MCWSLILLVVLDHPAFSAIRPSFSLDYSSWHATHIVLVITTSTGGTFEVVESWKDDLRVGELLVIPELRPTSKAIPISRYPKSWSAAFRGGVSELTAGSVQSALNPMCVQTYFQPSNLHWKSLASPGRRRYGRFVRCWTIQLSPTKRQN
jgi:hypothetical protein